MLPSVFIPLSPNFSIFTPSILVIERQIMDRLKDELLTGFDEDGETFEFNVPWRERPADLDKLVKSQNTRVREVVASIGRDKDFDVLVNDPERDVRLQVAEWGREKDVDVLVNDSDRCIWEEIARQGRPEHLDDQ